MKIRGLRHEVWPFIWIDALVFALMAGVLNRGGWAWDRLSWLCGLPACVLAAYFFYFFRDPDRKPPADDGVVVAGADGVIARIADVEEPAYLKSQCVRISIFLSLFDVHVNRAPISGRSSFLGYFPGRHLFTFQEKSSDVNQHNKILIEGKRIRCLVTQIVGPVCRRVVYWPPHDKAVDVSLGERIGMMKFGSRLDIYLPAQHVTVLVKCGDVVRAGETIVARVRESTSGGQ